MALKKQHLPLVYCFHKMSNFPSKRCIKQKSNTKQHADFDRFWVSIHWCIDAADLHMFSSILPPSDVVAPGGRAASKACNDDTESLWDANG